MSLFNELKRRNVFKVAIAYGIVSWIFLQVGAIVFPALNLPDWTMTMLIVFTLIGFPFVMLFAWAFELTPDGIKSTKKIDQTESIRELTGHKINYFLVSGLAIALVLVVIDSYVLDDSPEPELVENEERLDNVEQVLIPIIEDLAIPEKSIAVLPFVNLSSDPEQEYFSDGLTEELLNKLAQVSDLQVAARTSSFYFKGRNENMQEIGGILGVAYLLEGSVRKSADQIRITAQLIQADNGFHLWSETYDRQLEDIFAVQDEIAESVSMALSITLSAGEFNRLGMTKNIEAYDVSLQAKLLRSSQLLNTVREAVELAETATRLDPSSSLLWVDLASTYRTAMNWLPREESNDFPVLINEALEQARALTPALPDILLADAAIALSNNDWLSTEAILQQLLQGDDTANTEVYLTYANFLLESGRVQESMPYLQRARRLDPLSVDTSLLIAFQQIISGRSEEAFTEAEYGLTLGGNEPNLWAMQWVSFLQEDDREAAIDFLLQNFEETGNNNLEEGQWLEKLVQILAMQDLNQVLDELSLLRSEDSMPPSYQFQWTTVGADFGLAEFAFEGVKQGNVGPTLWAPLNAEVRQLPSFKPWLIEIGLEEYWRATGQWGDYCRPIDESDFECI